MTIRIDAPGWRTAVLVAAASPRYSSLLGVKALAWVKNLMTYVIAGGRGAPRYFGRGRQRGASVPVEAQPRNREVHSSSRHATGVIACGRVRRSRGRGRPYRRCRPQPSRSTRCSPLWTPASCRVGPPRSRARPCSRVILPFGGQLDAKATELTQAAAGVVDVAATLDAISDLIAELDEKHRASKTAAGNPRAPIRWPDLPQPLDWAALQPRQLV